MLQSRLTDLNRISTSFLSTVVRQLRLYLAEQFKSTKGKITDMSTLISKVQATLVVFRYEPEYIYIILIVIIGLLISMTICMIILGIVS